MKPPWTQQDLAELACRELQNEGAEERALSERTLRFYRAQALLDPPLAWDGRKPLFGEAHLRQVIEIRRLQARGMSLEQIRGLLARQAAGEEGFNEGLQLSGDPDRSLRRRRERAWARPTKAEPLQEMEQGFPNPQRATPLFEAVRPVEDSAESAPPSVTRLGPGLYLLVDSQKDLDPETVAAALSRAGQVLRQQLIRKGKDPKSE